jgi:hypothetical protein
VKVLEHFGGNKQFACIMLSEPLRQEVLHLFKAIPFWTLCRVRALFRAARKVRCHPVSF